MSADKKRALESSDRQRMAEALNKIVTTQSGFISAVDTFKQYNETVIGDLDRRIDVKRQEWRDLNEELDHKLKNGQLELEQKLKEYGRRAVIDILKQTNETVIGNDELQALRSELAALRNKDQAAVQQLTQELKEKHNRKLGAALRAKELEFTANIAEIKAISGQQNREIDSLSKQIITLQTELKAQRELTQKVAEASRPQVMQPTYGGDNARK